MKIWFDRLVGKTLPRMNCSEALRCLLKDGVSEVVPRPASRVPVSCQGITTGDWRVRNARGRHRGPSSHPSLRAPSEGSASVIPNKSGPDMFSPNQHTWEELNDRGAEGGGNSGPQLLSSVSVGTLARLGENVWSVCLWHSWRARHRRTRHAFI